MSTSKKTYLTATFTVTLILWLSATLFAEALPAGGSNKPHLQPDTPSESSFIIAGKITNEQNESLVGAHVVLFTQADTLLIRGAASDLQGTFALERIPPGRYHLTVSYMGYQTALIPIALEDQDITGLHIQIVEDAHEMEAIEITARAEPMAMRGDTTVYTAAAFPVHSDALAEDLIRRMPGFSIQDGRLFAQGEQVQQVLVDGEEFFGNDPTIALRNLPAEIIRQIEVFDQATDQAAFTGFDDGQSIRTVNIVTRSGISQGQFGQLNASLGYDDYYLGGGSINLFSGNRRISILGLTNNINQVNFSGDLLSGVAEAAASVRSRGSGPGGGMGGGGGTGVGGGSGDWSGPDNTRDFLIGESSGINTTRSIGINYVDRWGDAWRVSGSYFLNSISNINERELEREFLDPSLDSDFYYETSNSASEAWNHRFQARIEVEIDELRSLVLRPRLSFNTDDSFQNLDAFTTGSSPVDLLNTTNYLYDRERSSYDLNNSLLYRRRFDTQGRTFSMNVTTRANSSASDQLHTGESIFYLPAERLAAEHQLTDLLSEDRSFGAFLQYTEPLGERTQIMFSYRPSVDLSTSDRDVRRSELQDATLIQPDPQRSSQYETTEISHRPGIGYRIRGEGWNLNTSLEWQYTNLEGTQSSPYQAQTQRTFTSLVPRANLMYRFSETTRLRFMYTMQSRTPSAAQLQDVIDTTDPLMFTGGNPQLTEQYVHRVNMRYESIQPEKQSSFLAFLQVNYTRDHIGNSTLQPVADTLLAGDVLLSRGSRLVTPENVGNAWNMRSLVNYSVPIASVRSNLNINTGLTLSQTPSLLDGVRNHSHQTGLEGGINLISTISREVDFTLGYTASHQFVRNSIRTDLNNDYYMGRATARVHLLPWEWLVISTDMNVRHYEGLPETFAQNTWYWNVSVGYRFLSDRSARLSLSVVDLLAQNRNVLRTATDLYIQDSRSQVLTRYAMLSLSWNFRSISEAR